MDGRKLREIVEGAKFQKSIAPLRPDAKRLDEALWVVTWALSRDAEEASWSMPETGLRVVFTDPFPGLPALRIFVTVEENSVILQWAEAVPDGT